MQTAQENIDLQTTILSRFDLIFIVKDARDHQRDMVQSSHTICKFLKARRNNKEWWLQVYSNKFRNEWIVCFYKNGGRRVEKVMISLLVAANCKAHSQSACKCWFSGKRYRGARPGELAEKVHQISSALCHVSKFALLLPHLPAFSACGQNFNLS